MINAQSHWKQDATQRPALVHNRSPRSLGFASLLFAFCLFQTGCFEMSSDVAALRDSLAKASASECDPEIEVGVGALVFNLARAGLTWIDLDPEARAALDAARGVEIGVYRLRSGRQRLNRAAMLLAADKEMAARGWDRLVAVVKGRELVAVYVPGDMRSARNVKFCAVVLEGTKLVLVSARSNLEPILNLALDRSELREKAPWLRF